MGPYNLICVAHPDDETLFFAGLILSRRQNNLPWLVVCATSDGNEDRHRQFNQACELLGVQNTQWWNFLDKYEQRLPIADLVAKLKSLPTPNEIFTHGIVGEYGHPHHQDVSFAVHLAFPAHPRLYSAAYNAFPEFEIHLFKEDFALKAKILTEVYGSETSRFLNILPATFVEGFFRMEFSEVEAIYDYLARDRELRLKDLKTQFWLKDYLPQLRDLKRMF
jgi:LmbE family N-acetylglucosaminyl deacetylase